jgi:hypothetical protein
MDLKIKEKWIAALRSGEYIQGKNFLRTVNNEFCCLGVLAEVCGINSVINNDEDAYHYDFDSTPLTAYPSIDFLFSVSLDNDDAEYLTKLNDAGSSFDEIADYIKEKL